MAKKKPPHGTDNCYTNYGCRRPECRKAHAAKVAKWRKKVRRKS